MIKLTYKLLAEFLRIFQYNGVINVYWNGTILQTISEDSDIKDLKDLPQSCTEKDFYVEFPGEKEVEFDKALEYINFRESLKIF